MARLIYPKCLSGKGYGYSARGWMIPCCWLDPLPKPMGHGAQSMYDEVENKFFTEELKLSNNDTLDDIINSDTWTKFYDDLIEDQSNALGVCKRYCGKKKSTKKMEFYTDDPLPSEEDVDEKRSANSSSDINVIFPEEGK